MKKKLLPLVMILVFAGFTAAQEEVEGNGWVAGIGFGFGNVLEEMTITAIPQVTYDNTFGPVNLYLQLEVRYSFFRVFYRTTDMAEGILEIPQYGCLEGELAWNFFQASSALFTFTLNEKAIFNNQDSKIADLLPTISPNQTGEWFSGVLDPNFTYTQDVNSDEVFGTVGLPITYAFSSKPNPSLGTYLTLGYNSSFGFGIEVTGQVNLYPDPDYAGTEYLFYCKNEKIYFELKLLTNKKLTAFTLTPMVEGAIKNFILGGELEVGNMKGNSTVNSVTLIPTIWVKYRF